jgi:hypothetical protein
LQVEPSKRLQNLQPLLDKYTNEDMFRRSKSPYRKLEISAPLDVKKNDTNTSLSFLNPRDVTRPPDRTLLSIDYQATRTADASKPAHRSPSKLRRKSEKHPDTNSNASKENVSLFGRVKGAISQRYNGSSSLPTTRYLGEHESSRSTLFEEQSKPKQSEESMVESSPKLQRFFGSDGKQDIKTSSHRRNRSVDGHVTSRNNHVETAAEFLMSDMAGSSDVLRPRPQTLMAVGRDSFDVFANWATDSIQAIGNDYSTEAAGLGIAGAQLYVNPALLDRSNSQMTLVDAPNLSRADPAFSSFDFFSGRLPPSPSSHRQVTRFTEQISGLQQHPNVMEFAEPPAWCTVQRPPTPAPSRGNSRQSSHVNFDGSTAVDSQEFFLGESMMNEDFIPPLPGVPEINIKRASDISKRNSTDAELVESPSTLRRCKKFCLEDGASFEEDTRDIMFEDLKVNTLTGHDTTRGKSFENENRDSTGANSFSTMQVEPDDSDRNVTRSAGKLKMPTKSRRKSLPVYYRRAPSPGPMPAKYVSPSQHPAGPRPPPPPSRSVSGTDKLWELGRIAKRNDGVEGDVNDQDHYDMYDEDELQMDQEQYVIGWAR